MYKVPYPIHNQMRHDNFMIDLLAIAYFEAQGKGKGKARQGKGRSHKGRVASFDRPAS